MHLDHFTTVLTIEDDRLVRKAIASYLQGLGYNVLQAADGAEGLEIFRRGHPDIVLMDLRLPERDGMELLSVIRGKSPDTPVIIVSGMGTLKCHQGLKTWCPGFCNQAYSPMPSVP